MKTKIILLLISFFFFILVSASQCFATLMVDQANVIDTSGSNWDMDVLVHYWADEYAQLVQTFTVGIAGTLSRVDLETYWYKSADVLRVDLWKTTGTGAPDSSVSLAHWFIDNTNSSVTVGSFVSCDLGRMRSRFRQAMSMPSLSLPVVSLILRRMDAIGSRAHPIPMPGGSLTLALSTQVTTV